MVPKAPISSLIKVHASAATLANVDTIGYEQTNTAYLTRLLKSRSKKVKAIAEENEINFFYI
jgi:glycine dehydrogenase